MKPVFIMMVGLPASGKSTYAETVTINWEKMNIHSSDKIRSELFGDDTYQEENDKVFQELSKRVKNDLVNGVNCIHDATNISWKRRKAFVESLNKIDCHKVCFLMATPYEKCLEYNNLRERKVPEHVIKRMYKHIWIPQLYEGWEDIVIIMNSDPLNQFELFNDLKTINQDNPNHTLTIGEHCEKCFYEIDQLGEYISIPLSQAALFHDIGKKFCKEFKNAKGEQTEIAHYYQHHLVSAYDSLFYNAENIRLEIANYIQWHMQPFFMDTENTKEKYRKLWGDQFYRDIMLLHEADVRAK